MSKRGEEAAMELFPVEMELVPLPDGDTIEEDVNRWKRKLIEIGYEQAEKDYAKLKELADNMYLAAQYLTTDASSLHRAMEEYHRFVVYGK